MKQHVKLFEEFICSPEELALKRQFATSALTAAIPVTHNVSQIVKDESGVHVEIGNKEKITVIVSKENEK